jgi:hypothetical protein
MAKIRLFAACRTTFVNIDLPCVGAVDSADIDGGALGMVARCTTTTAAHFRSQLAPA